MSLYGTACLARESRVFVLLFLLNKDVSGFLDPEGPLLRLPMRFVRSKESTLSVFVRVSVLEVPEVLRFNPIEFTNDFISVAMKEHNEI